ncbi:MAG: hypothetical protein A2W05_02140 [Candidatus Schekmanbacteria bacterium RBG_16_38_10]|uniref:Probable periplasmic serine endoprotease DegP-like n=1 Tax=Candidatus Schekmanbacteria bacterium RBG_16_38_10 TaxID=1817879 RepID=A0A1F7S029_9BACT|nr:MAG: hypothetical protein A2W05_02140 [Candidatus Schekmanbacteria bacterium RBG_16_38_10]
MPDLFSVSFNKMRKELKIICFSFGISLFLFLALTPLSNGQENESQRVPYFVKIAKDIKPSVVSIYTLKPLKKEKIKIRGKKFKNSFWVNDTNEDINNINEDINNITEDKPNKNNLGTGFIIDTDGYILTNNHVIANAEEFKVSLENGREYEGRVIGKDFKTDLALVKIEKAENLAVPKLGNSDKLEVGEWVMAIGSPVGLGQTVTAGIVSAKKRSIGVGPYDNFIQTDVPINAGSSGGPLINMDGEIVGINTLRLNGLQGIGFAIPINMTKDIIRQLKEKGRVTRGWLGVLVRRWLEEINDKVTQNGVLIIEVKENSPAFIAGLKSGDFIVKYDGKEIEEASSLPVMIAETTPGKEIEIKIIRNKEEKNLKVKIEELHEEGKDKVNTDTDNDI